MTTRVSNNMQKELSFASRAEFEAATIPDHVQTWSVRHNGSVLNYKRDAAGTAITSANGVSGSPSGPVRLDHFDGNTSLMLAYMQTIPVGDRYFSTSEVTRMPSRAFVGAAASQSGGQTTSAGGATFIATEGVGYYLERSANLLSVSDRGGIAVTGASRASDRYTAIDAVAWQASTACSLNDRLGWRGQIYTVTVAGTTGTTPPTHTSGAAANGTATLTFDDFSYVVPIGGAFIGVSDVVDGSGTWAGYFEGVRKSGGGTVYAAEIAVKNQGSDVVATPYTAFPAGSTWGWYFAGGGDATVGAPANPATGAILIKKNGHTFNSGITFASDALTGSDGVTGTATAVEMAKGHRIRWKSSSTQNAGEIRSDVTAEGAQTRAVFTNSGFLIRGVRSDLATETTIFQVSTPTLASGQDVNGLQVSPNAWSSGTGVVNVSAVGPATNINIAMAPKGSGEFQVAAGNRLRVSSVGVGFNGTAPQAKPTVTGSRGGNLALQSLISALAANGLITDGTST